jgi:hypothetical protein
VSTTLYEIAAIGGLVLAGVSNGVSGIAGGAYARRGGGTAAHGERAGNVIAG